MFGEEQGVVVVGEHCGGAEDKFAVSINNIVRENLMADIQRERGRRWKGNIHCHRAFQNKTKSRLQKKWQEKYGKEQEEIANVEVGGIVVGRKRGRGRTIHVELPLMKFK